MNPITKSQVEEIVTELSTKCYQTGITVKIVSDPFLDASMNNRTKELRIGQWLLDELPEPQLRGILGHEIGHLALKAYSSPKSLKLKAMILLAAIIVICSVIAVCFIDKMIWSFIVFPLIIIVIVMVIVFMGFYIPIKDEFNADLLAVTLTGDPHSLLFAVESVPAKMKEKAKKRPKTISTVIRKILSCFCRPRAKFELKLRKEQLQELISYQKSNSIF